MTEVDVSSRSVQLCMAGTTAEFERRLDDARRLYREAWDAAIDDYDAAVASHYVGHLEPDPDEALRWHAIALERGLLDARADLLMGSLLVSLGGAYERVGRIEDAELYFAKAAERGVIHYRRSDASGSV